MVEHDLAGIGQPNLAAAAVERVSPTSSRAVCTASEIAGWVRASFDRRAREALFGGDGTKNFKGGKIHGISLSTNVLTELI